MTPLQNRSVLTQRNFKFAVVFGGAAVIAAFFIYEFKYLRAPDLAVVSPARDLALRSGVIEVKGRTDPDADLTLNGRPLYSGGTGEFADSALLAKGTNALVFEAKNRYGKTSVITRYVVVR